MDKLKMQTPDLTDKNIEQIAQLFPNVITETKDEKGNVKKVVDFPQLKQVLSKNLVENDNERYRLDWPGKKASLLKANTPITKTLRPCREESVNFDATENIYIEGDNFEVLKILQESYLDKVKMIYIDPPYNTGNDFIYKDNFTKSKEEYEEELGANDEEGGRLFRNTDSNGRFHSDWLSMMYERLVVARDLLKDDGVIFISIDDGEVTSLRKLCDEIFGENNFIAQLVMYSNPRGRQSSNFFPETHEYVLTYSKNISTFKLKGLELTNEQKKEYSYIDEAGNYREIGLRLRGGRATATESPTLHFPVYYNKNTDTLSVSPIEDGIEIIPKFSDGTLGTWRWSKKKIMLSLNELKVRLVNSSDGRKYDVFQKDYLTENKRRKPKSLWMEKEINYDRSKDDLRVIGLNKVFDYSKPSYLIKKIALLSTNKSDIVLDFFAGSATTAHAVMQLNAEDNGNRKFIMVQLPKLCDDKSEAFKAGYKTIADIGKERIRRTGKKIVKENADKLKKRVSPLDIGFRVYKTDETNMKDVFYHPNELKQDQLSFLESNIKEDRAPEDLLTQIILDLGLELSLPIETKKMQNNTVHVVQTNALVACFDNNIDFKIVDIISDLKPLKVVFKDASFKDDKDRINVEERFKRLSPETKVTVI
ncbi:MAG: site-specific DNA-methyltransferase [Candidatus Saelkia tenebricola]|nr:site-specific DNA-methyltransferase [Candidatus Saelkia tenebricola]